MHTFDPAAIIRPGTLGATAGGAAITADQARTALARRNSAPGAASGA